MFPYGYRAPLPMYRDAADIGGSDIVDDAFAITPAQLTSIENKIIDSGLFMGLNPETRTTIDRIRDYKMYTPGTQFGFDLQIESCAKYDPQFCDRNPQTSKISSRRLVSLACLDECANLPHELCGPSTIDRFGSVESNSSGRPSFVEMYGSKLPLMCVNVSRLAYTTELFRYYAYKTTAATDRLPHKIGRRPESFEALNFYLKIDTVDASSAFDCRTRVRSQPNLEFSTLLHRLQSDGYIEYIVALARRLRLDIDLLTDRNPHIVYVYKNARHSTVGVLTAYYHASRWYVTVSDRSLTVE